MRQLRRNLTDIHDKLKEREAHLPSTFLKDIRYSIKVLQTWRDAKQPSRDACREFLKRAASHGTDTGSEKTLHEVGLKLHEVLIREGHELLRSGCEKRDLRVMMSLSGLSSRV